MGLIIEIPQFTGKLEIPLNTPHFHIGKQELKNAIVVIPKDEKAFEPISSVRKDNAGIITRNNSSYILQITNIQLKIEEALMEPILVL